MGIMAGIGTVLADDPMLNVRVEGWKSPVRIVCDSKLRIPPDSQIVKSAEKYRTIVAYAEQKNAKEKIKILHTMGVETIYCPDEKNQIDLKKRSEEHTSCRFSDVKRPGRRLEKSCQDCV